ncbi:uncharacterized protein A1O5_00487 [Cladophialophora psammophila CBS 110553]|uniref:CN hydrolase domain-containing protein n=1 Tax=Cladophialophora psammophila CBS 110553 TaxID=1182543 RepID=W9Y0G8_9EURO|nr:uncharacterized protein A1O5_00487 [Cladophialophora psammophila CBS 110553]EXJ75979.1 hypothetical protein A1O5_00487 [Cladophialophora psammophila CBS 110553]
MSTSASFKVAAVQAAPVAFDLPASLQKVRHFTKAAAQECADLVVFPEGFLSAYPWRYAFDATIGAREPRGRQWFSKYYNSAMAIPSAEFEELRTIARDYNVFLSLGIIEKERGTLYCTAILLSRTGDLLYAHRKLIPTAAERLVWGRGAGDGLQVVDTEIGRVGGLICWENYMPAARLSLYQQGIEVYIAPNADDLPAWVASMQHIAKEGRCFVISCNQFCKVADFPSDYPPFSPGHHDRQRDGSPWTPDAILSHGGSCIVGPLGTFIAEPVWDREEIIYGQLRMDDLIQARMDFDPVGSYARPDIFTLTVNRRPGDHVVFKCRYVKSNRGGPRVSRKKAIVAVERQRRADEAAFQTQEIAPDINIDWDALILSSEEIHNDLIATMIAPGAGLIDVDDEDDCDQIFDNIFMPPSEGDDTINALDDDPQGKPYTPITRSYQDSEAILNAYYIFIHPYFPILPPPVTTLQVDDPASESKFFEPASPLVMALMAILVLIPHPEDEYPDSDESVCLRRQRAHSFSQMAMESIEIETELLESITNPSEALDHRRPSVDREKLHPCVPVELEGVLAHLLLSIYEYAQRGNLAKMRNRASQAYDAAIRLCLHDISDLSLDEYTEARRRAWWMTYIVVLQASIVSSTPPIISIDFHQFKTPLPTVPADPDAWPFFIEAQQCILRCTQYTVALKKALEAGLGDSTLDQRKAILESGMDSVHFRYASSPTEPSALSPTDAEEHTLANSLRLQALIKLNSARIKLHRYRAFQDVPIFTRRHCDLDQADTSSPRPLGCSCHAMLPSAFSNTSPKGFQSGSFPGPWSQSPNGGSLDASSDHADALTKGISITDLPAAKTCLKAALAIGRAFESFPYPNPMQLPLPMLSSPMLSTASSTPTPRTMPSFACCAMQSCYTLLTLCYKSLEMRCVNQRSSAADKGLEDLYAGVGRVLRALQNYAIAFEALNGMTQQVEEALEALKRIRQHNT